MTFIEKQIIQKIEEYDNISLFFHEIPDFDALGSCFALKLYLNDKYPKKHVEVIGLDTLSDSFGKDLFVFDHKYITNNFLKDSLGIILDTANAKRVWSNRQIYCKELIRIDHHPLIENFSNIEYIDDKASSTCELVGTLMYNWDEKYVSERVALYLYAGILTDTARFLYDTTRQKTFELAAKLISKKLDRNLIHKSIYLKSFRQLRFESYIASLIKFDKDLRFGYAVIPRNAFDKFDIDLRFSMVHVFNNVKELDVWMTIYYDNTVNKWRGSLRSRDIPINKIAEKYSGGGHIHAAGFTLQSKKEYKHLVKDVSEYIREIAKKKE